MWSSTIAGRRRAWSPPWRRPNVLPCSMSSPEGSDSVDWDSGRTGCFSGEVSGIRNPRCGAPVEGGWSDQPPFNGWMSNTKLHGFMAAVGLTQFYHPTWTLHWPFATGHGTTLLRICSKMYRMFMDVPQFHKSITWNSGAIGVKFPCKVVGKQAVKAQKLHA